MREKNKAGMQIRVGVVGCGGVAQVFHLPILHKHPDVKIQALCDLDTSKAVIIADKFKIKNVYQDIAEMLRKEKLDLVFLLTPNNFHLPMSLMALEHKANVFIEKPAALNAGEAQRIQEKAVQMNRVVMIGMHNRFHTDVRAIRQFITGNELGKLFFAKAGWLQATHQSVKQSWIFKKNVSGGGVVMDLGVQFIDLVWWLLGKPELKSVKAVSFKVKEDFNVEDFCVAYLSFDNGISVSMEVSWDFPIPKDRLFVEIVGGQGTATLYPLRMQKLWHNHFVNITPQVRYNKAIYLKKGYENEVNHLINYLTGSESRLESSIEDAVQVHKIIDKIYQSLNEDNK